MPQKITDKSGAKMSGNAESRSLPAPHRSLLDIAFYFLVFLTDAVRRALFPMRERAATTFLVEHNTTQAGA